MDVVHDLSHISGIPSLVFFPSSSSLSMSHHHHHHHNSYHPYNSVLSPPRVVPNENDVLCGRGVNIAQHPGNERFRTLVNAKREAALSSCHGDPEAAAALEKRHVAEGIIAHIKGLDPPGRFLRREVTPGRRSASSRGKNGSGLDLSGTWQVLSDREAIKKACQALRDCARTDRNGYAVGVLAPPDVQEVAHQVEVLTAGTKRTSESSSSSSSLIILPESVAEAFSMSGQHLPISLMDEPSLGGRLSPSVDVAASWLKRQKVAESSGGSNSNHNLFERRSLENGSIYSSSRNHSADDLCGTDAAVHAVAMSMLSPHMMSASPQLGEYCPGCSYTEDDRSFTPEDINGTHHHHHNDASDHSHPLRSRTDSSSLTDHHNPYHNHPDDVSLSREAAEVAVNLVSSMQNDPAHSDWGEEIMVSAPDETNDDDDDDNDNDDNDMDHHEVFSQSQHVDFTVGGVDDLENLDEDSSEIMGM